MLNSVYSSRFLVSLAVAAMLALPAGPTVAAVLSGDYVGKTHAEITKTLEMKGYKVEEVDQEDEILEAEVTLDGKLYEISTDSRTGKIVEIVEGEKDNDGSILKRLFGIGK